MGSKKKDTLGSLPKEASEFLGVSIATLKRWEWQKKIKSTRLPNGYRSYSIQELKRVKDWMAKR